MKGGILYRVFLCVHVGSQKMRASSIVGSMTSGEYSVKSIEFLHAPYATKIFCSIFWHFTLFIPHCVEIQYTRPRLLHNGSQRDSDYLFLFHYITPIIIVCIFTVEKAETYQGARCLNSLYLGFNCIYCYSFCV